MGGRTAAPSPLLPHAALRPQHEIA